MWMIKPMIICTGYSLSEALILASNNPKYDNRLFVELRVQYMKTTSSEHIVYIKLIQNHLMYTTQTCSFLVLNSQINKQSVVTFWVN